MVETVGSMLEEVFDEIPLELSGVVFDASLTYVAKGAYTPSTDSYADTPTTISSLEAMFVTSRPIKSIFPESKITPNNHLVLLRGSTVEVKKTMELTINSVVYIVDEGLSILGNTEMSYVMVQEKQG